MSPELEKALTAALEKSDESTVIGVLNHVECYGKLPVEVAQETQNTVTYSRRRTA